MKLVGHFRTLLDDTVNLNRSRIDRLDSRLDAVSSYLQQHPTLGPAMVEVIPQGSFAHKTIIKPVGSHGFDADVLLSMHEQREWEAYDYTRKVRAALADSATYRDKVGRRTRSVELDYAGDFHIDLVPFLATDGGGWITNHKTNSYELTNPEGFSRWLDERDRIAKRRLVEVIRLMKYLRDLKQTFTVKSFILSMLLAQQVTGSRLVIEPNVYNDLPTAFLTVLEDLDRWLQARPTMPPLVDPSCPSETFNHRWTQAHYDTFRERIHGYAGTARAAFDERDKTKSVQGWQKLFGPAFKAPAARAMQLREAAALPAPVEQFIDGPPWNKTVEIDPTQEVRISARTVRRGGMDRYELATRGNRVAKHRTILFTLGRCTVREPFDLYWKVRNYGSEAGSANGLRGEITRDHGDRLKREPTAYRGSHYVEVYVVVGGRCVARDRQRVDVI